MKNTHIINFRVTDREREKLDQLVNWINHEDQRSWRYDNFKRSWGHVSISEVIRWCLHKAHPVIQSQIISTRKTVPGSSCKTKLQQR